MSSRPFIQAGNGSLFKIDENLRDWIVSIRRHIHRYPELSFNEFRTSAFIQEKLEELDITPQIGIGTTGVCGILGEGTGPCVALRADMDALPILEETGLVFASEHQGIMHACGHDGHVAMLLGAAALLKRIPKLPGRVKLVFQPAEERGNGACRLVDEGVIDDVEAIFAGHIDTHFDTGVITVDDGIICAFADPFNIRITGRSGHAARPHEAADTIVAASSLVMMIQTLVSRGVDPNKAEVITIGSFQAGTVHNIIAGEALLKGTVRSTDEETRLKTMDGLKRVVQSVATMYGIEAELVFEEGLPAVINSRRTADIARRAAWQVTDIDNVISQGYPSLGGEDFAFYQQKIEGCMVRFGGAPSTDAGVSHSTTFDFDERCLEIGASWLAAAAIQWLNQNDQVPGL